jgi:stage II sporulation protein D
MKALFRRFGKGRFAGALLALMALGLFACVSESEHIYPVETVAPQRDELQGEPVFRVLLVENGGRATIGATGGCQITASTGETMTLDKLADTVVLPGDRVFIKLERPFVGSSEIRVVPLPGSQLRLDGKGYRGDMVVTLDKGALRVVNHVKAEDYVAGVLGGEVPLKWPDAALKAQAIAARTYALFHMKNAHHADFDVFADTRSQVYAGAGSPRAVAIVQATEGRVLTYEWRIFEAYFFAACAGETASEEWLFKTPAIEPLAGATCGFCATCPHAHWERRFTNDQLAAAFAAKGVKAPVERVETIAWPRGGYVSEVRLRHAGGETTIAGPDFRVALNAWSKKNRPEAAKDLDIKSTAFEVAADPTSPATLVITGKGWGHGVGLCQWGAKGAADSGMDEDAILRRYYPGADISKLY